MNRILSLGCMVTAAGFGVGLSCQALGFRWWGFAMCVAEALAVVGWSAAGRRQERAVRPRPDYARIALLEQELLGIKPEPGTFLAATEALSEAFAPRGIRRDRSPVFNPGGFVSSNRTIKDLPPFPDAMTKRRADCRHQSAHTLTLMNGFTDTICLDCGMSLPPKPVPPPGPGAGSPTVR